LVLVGHLTHYNHSNLVKGITKWDDDEACRDFKSVQEMNDLLIHNFNEKVMPNDILWLCGDIAWGSMAIIEFMNRLNCKNVYIVLGNHDKDIDKGSDYIKSLFKYIGRVIDIDVDGVRVILSHFAFRVWNKSHFGSYHLYGHSHGRLEDLKTSLSMDVGVDTNNFYPYSWKEIVERMKKKEFKPISREKGNINYH
jgi:calcineurin-like phosphoesterase family protein